MRILSSLFICFVILAFAPKQSSRAFFINGVAQGTTYHIAYYAKDSIVTKSQIDSIFQSIDSSLSLYKPYSLVNQFNKSAMGIEADSHLLAVVAQGIKTYRSTKGIFDISVYPFTEAWGFGVKRTDRVPDKTMIHQLSTCVGTDLLFISGNKLQKKKDCVRLDPNGIAQGYTVDILGNFLDIHGVENWLVEVGGELKVKGRKQPSNELMKVAIEVPGEDGLDFSLQKRVISIDHGAITTSGSYRKFYESQGKKISHIIDARTGFPAKNELISVTVYARDAIVADAFDNALMVMGLKKALAFTEKRNDISAHFIYRKRDGSIADTASSRFQKLFINSND